MIWAACCTAYFGLLRVSKFIASSRNHSNLFTDLLLSDIAIDSQVAPQVIRITLKQSKTDQYRQGTHIYLGRTSHSVCPVKALIHYLDRHGGRPGPLFMLPNNQLLTRATFSAALNEIFQKLNIHLHNFNTHSFRISAATSAKQAGISDSHIKALGRWKSNVYLKYVRVSPQDLCKLSKHLVTSPNPRCWLPPSTHHHYSIIPVQTGYTSSLFYHSSPNRLHVQLSL